jgi:hypothetical protein
VSWGIRYPAWFQVGTSVADALFQDKPELTAAFITEKKTPRHCRGVRVALAVSAWPHPHHL